MTRSLVFALVLAGCPSKTKPPTTGEPLPPKRIVVNWGFAASDKAAHTDVFLALTDETGKQTSHPVGTFAGSCQRVAPTDSALTAATCLPGSGSTTLHVFVQGNQLLVLHSGLPGPTTPEQITQVGFPLGAAVSVAP